MKYQIYIKALNGQYCEKAFKQPFQRIGWEMVEVIRDYLELPNLPIEVINSHTDGPTYSEQLDVPEQLARQTNLFKNRAYICFEIPKYFIKDEDNLFHYKIYARKKDNGEVYEVSVKWEWKEDSKSIKKWIELIEAGEEYMEATYRPKKEDISE